MIPIQSIIQSSWTSINLLSSWPAVRDRVIIDYYLSGLWQGKLLHFEQGKKLTDRFTNVTLILYTMQREIDGQMYYEKEQGGISCSGFDRLINFNKKEKLLVFTQVFQDRGGSDIVRCTRIINCRFKIRKRWLSKVIEVESELIPGYILRGELTRRN